MNKFWTLFRKEIRELVTLQTMIGLFVSVLIFLMLGNMMGDITEDFANDTGKVAVVDHDQSGLSQQAVVTLQQAGFEIVMLQGEDPLDLLKQASQEHLKSYIEIPKNFAADINAGKQTSIPITSRVDTLSMMSISHNISEAAVDLINQQFSDSLIKSSSPDTDAAFLKKPVSSTNTTVIGDASANVEPNLLKSLAMQQSIFIPIIVFILIMFATQMTVSTIASEKGDKTLETLLSAPVSRLAVLSSKMCAAGALSLLMAAVYMVGFSSYMGSMTGGMGIATNDMSVAMETLGISLSAGDYVLVGIQLFLTILITLALSIILGALSKDIKSAQGMITPIIFLALIPYLISMLMDINTLPATIRFLIYAIPFTHTFTASSNIIFDNTLLFFGGMLYQLVLLVGILFVAVKIFSTDQIFTIKISLGKKRKLAFPKKKTS